MPYEISLENLLSQRDPDLFQRLILIKSKVEPLMTFTAGGFPFYTPHDFLHSKNVEENLNWLIPDKVKYKLDVHEIFFLILAAWLHDWGMVCKPNEIPKEVRETHHLRTESYFEQQYKDVLLDIHEARIVGKISRGHRKENLRDTYYDSIVFGNTPIDIRFLSAVLRIADECDLTYNRVPELIYNSLSPDGTSEEHFKRHLRISGITIYPETPYKITFNAMVTDPKGAKTIRQLKEKIQSEIDHCKAILGERGMPIELVEAKIEANGFVDQPIAFRLDTERVTKLLIGEGIYKRKDVAVRELLQNSTDACKYKLALNPTYSPYIRIYLENGNLVVEDNGIGMSYYEALNYLSNKGKTFYKSTDFDKIRDELKFNPIGMWGIGTLSCFMIASGMVIETKKQGLDPCKFTVRDVGDGWRYDHCLRSETGTKFVLHLQEEWNEQQLEDVVRYYVRDVEIPIFIGKITTVPLGREPFLRRDIDLADDDEYTDHNEYPNFECVNSYEDEDIKVRVYYPQEEKRSSLLMRGRVLLLNRGFIVNFYNRERLPGVSTSSGLIYVIDLKNDLVDLMISRDQVRVDTDKYYEFLEKWNSILISFFKHDFTELKKKNEQNGNLIEIKINELQIIAASNYGLVPFDKTNGAFIEPEKHQIKTLKEFEISTYKFLILYKNKLQLMTLEEIRRNPPEKLVFYYTLSRVELSSDVKIIREIGRTKLSDSMIIFNIQSHSYYTDNYDLVALISNFVGKEESFEEMNVQTLLMGIDYEKNKTDLDTLLPSGSYFSSLPAELKGGVICKSPFTIQLTKQGIAHLKKTQEKKRVFSLLAFMPRFLGNIADVNVNGLLTSFVNDTLLFGKSDFNNFKVEKSASFVFDYNDEVIELLIKNSDVIIKDPHLSTLTENYFSLLSSYFINPQEGSFDTVKMRELELLKLLNVGKEVGNFGRRFGESTNQLVKWMAPQSITISSWPYVKLDSIPKDITAKGHFIFISNSRSMQTERELL